MKKKHRILMALPYFPYPVMGGLEKQSNLLAENLASSKDFEIVVLSCKFSDHHSSYEERNAIKVHRIPYFKDKILRFLTMPFHIVAFFLKHGKNLEIVHLHQLSWFSIFTILIAKISRKKVVTKLPNSGDFGLHGVGRSFLGFIKLKILKFSDAFVCMTEDSKKELDNINWPKNKIIFVSNGIEILQFEEQEKKSLSSRLKLIFLGRLVEQKNLVLLIRALNILINQKKFDIGLEIYGKGNQGKLLAKEINKYDLNDHIKLKGQVSNIREKLLENDVLILPSRVEGNSNAILEAMEAGTPVIATNVGGAAKQLGKEGAAFLINEININGISQSIEYAYVNRGKLFHIGLLMRERIKRNFDIKLISEVYENYYLRLLDKES